MPKENSEDHEHLRPNFRNDKFEWIDKYLLNELSGAEIKEFEEKLAENYELKEVFDQQKLIVEGIRRSVARDEIKSMLEEIHSEIYSEPDKVPTGKSIDDLKYHISEEGNSKEDGMSASTILRLGLTLWQILTNSVGNRKILFNNLYSKYSDEYLKELEISQSDFRMASISKKIYSNYNSGYFEKVLDIFNSYKGEFSKYPDLLFYKGITELELEKVKDSIISFNSVILSKSKYEYHALWYTGLANIKLNNRSEALKSFKTLISSPDIEYRNKAEQIIKKLYNK